MFRPGRPGRCFWRGRVKQKQNEEPQASDLSRDNAQAHYGAKLKKRRLKTGAKVALAVVCVAVVGAIAGLAWYLNDVQSRLNEGVSSDLIQSLTQVEVAKDEPFYMLLLGVDKSQDRAESAEYGEDDSNYRSDSIMLARIDPQTPQVTLVSIHRDTLVDLGEYGKQKINAAYSFGGPSYAVDVISEFAGVPISHYAEIDFDSFADIVDTLGGIEVDVPIDIDDPLAGDPISAGWQTLNGQQALTLCRSRHAYDEYGDGDLYRAANQRMVIAAICKKILAADTATMTASISKLADSVTTDMSLSDILSLATQMKDINMDTDVYTGMEPTTSSYVNNTWYEICDTSAWRTMMQRVNQGLSPYESADDDPTGDVAGGTTNVKNEGGTDATDSTAGTGSVANSSDDNLSRDQSGTVEVLNAAGVDGLAGRVAQSLATYGWTTSAGTAVNHYDTTVVVYFDDSQEANAEAVAKALGGEVQVKNGTGVYTNNGSDVLVVLGTDMVDYE